MDKEDVLSIEFIFLFSMFYHYLFRCTCIIVRDNKRKRILVDGSNQEDSGTFSSVLSLVLKCVHIELIFRCD